MCWGNGVFVFVDFASADIGVGQVRTKETVSRVAHRHAADLLQDGEIDPLVGILVRRRGIRPAHESRALGVGRELGEQDHLVDDAVLALVILPQVPIDVFLSLLVRRAG